MNLMEDSRGRFAQNIPAYTVHDPPPLRVAPVNSKLWILGDCSNADMCFLKKLLPFNNDRLVLPETTREDPLWQEDICILGDTIHHDIGVRVVKSATSAGQTVAVKVKLNSCLYYEYEVEMNAYVYRNSAAKCPEILGSYRIFVSSGPSLLVVSMSFIPGQPPDKAWPTPSPSERQSTNIQLKEQLDSMRKHTQPYIGRILTVCPCAISLTRFRSWKTGSSGPFDSEKEWDEGSLARIRKRHGNCTYNKWRRRLKDG